MDDGAGDSEPVTPTKKPRVKKEKKSELGVEEEGGGGEREGSEEEMKVKQEVDEYEEA